MKLTTDVVNDSTDKNKFIVNCKPKWKPEPEGESGMGKEDRKKAGPVETEDVDEDDSVVSAYLDGEQGGTDPNVKVIWEKMGKVGRETAESEVDSIIQGVKDCSIQNGHGQKNNNSDKDEKEEDDALLGKMAQLNIKPSDVSSKRQEPKEDDERGDGHDTKSDEDKVTVTKEVPLRMVNVAPPTADQDPSLEVPKGKPRIVDRGPNGIPVYPNRNNNQDNNWLRDQNNLSCQLPPMSANFPNHDHCKNVSGYTNNLANGHMVDSRQPGMPCPSSHLKRGMDMQEEVYEDAPKYIRPLHMPQMLPNNLDDPGMPFPVGSSNPLSPTSLKPCSTVCTKQMSGGIVFTSEEQPNQSMFNLLPPLQQHPPPPPVVPTPQEQPQYNWIDTYHNQQLDCFNPYGDTTTAEAPDSFDFLMNAVYDEEEGRVNSEEIERMVNTAIASNRNKPISDQKDLEEILPPSMLNNFMTTTNNSVPVMTNHQPQQQMTLTDVNGQQTKYCQNSNRQKQQLQQQQQHFHPQQQDLYSTSPTGSLYNINAVSYSVKSPLTKNSPNRNSLEDAGYSTDQSPMHESSQFSPSPSSVMEASPAPSGISNSPPPSNMSQDSGICSPIPDINNAQTQDTISIPTVHPTQTENVPFIVPPSDINKDKEYSDKYLDDNAEYLNDVVGVLIKMVEESLAETRTTTTPPHYQHQQQQWQPQPQPPQQPPQQWVQQQPPSVAGRSVAAATVCSSVPSPPCYQNAQMQQQQQVPSGGRMGSIPTPGVMMSGMSTQSPVPAASFVAKASRNNGRANVGVVNNGNAMIGGLNMPVVTNGLNMPVVTNGLNMPAVTNGLNMPVVTNGLNMPVVTNGLNMPTVTNGLNMPTVTNGLNMPTVTNTMNGANCGSRVVISNTTMAQVNVPVITNGQQPHPSTLVLTSPSGAPLVNKEGKVAIPPMNQRPRPMPVITQSSVMLPVFVLPKQKPKLPNLAPKESNRQARDNASTTNGVAVNPASARGANSLPPSPPGGGGGNGGNGGGGGNGGNGGNGAVQAAANKASKKLSYARILVAKVTQEDLEFHDSEGDTNLHVAVCRSDSYLITALLERLHRQKLTSMINVQNKAGQTPLYLAVSINDPEKVRVLVEKQAKVTLYAEYNGTQEKKAAIHCASSRGETYLETLNALLAAPDIQVDQLDSQGHTALHCAILSHGKPRGDNNARINSLPIIEALVTAGANPNLQVQNGRTALMFALETGCLDLFEKLFSLINLADKEKCLKTQDLKGNSVLKIAERMKPTLSLQDQQRLHNCLKRSVYQRSTNGNSNNNSCGSSNGGLGEGV